MSEYRNAFREILSALPEDEREYRRADLIPLKLYHCTTTDEWFYTVDGIGVTWFEGGEAEAREWSDEAPIEIDLPLED